MQIKVGVLTSAHPPFDARVFLKECKSLSEAGYQVTLIVPHDQDEERDGVQIKAVPKRKGRFRRYTLTLWDLYREAVKLRAEIYHVHDPELLLVGALLKVRTGSKLIFDSHEDYLNVVLRRDWIPGPLRRLVSAVSRLVIRLTLPFFDAVIAATEEIGQRLHHRNTIVVKNYSQLNIGTYGNRHEPSLLVYAGVITNERGLSNFLEALQLINERMNVRVRLVGIHNDLETTEKIARQCPPDLVEIFGWLPQPEALALIATGTLGLVMDISHPGNDGPPTKLFDYMALGLPVVGGDLPTARKIIEEGGCGIIVDFRKPREIADGILQLLSDPDRLDRMRQRGFEAHKKYEWSSQAERLVALYRSLETTNGKSRSTEITPAHSGYRE